ncbi:MAG: pyridoxal phosphate-dependent aminotransferase [Myxococcales bacterium]
MSAPPESFIRKTVRPLAAYGPPRDPAPVPLHLNESPNDVPEDLKRALVEKLFRSDWSKYPITDGARLARTLAGSAGVDPAGTMVGNGSNELLQLLLFATLEPGDRVVVGAPSFALYALQARALGAEVVEVRLRQGDGSFRFPIDEIAKAARGAKVVLLGSPNNPTGTTMTAADVERLVTSCDALVGIDEAYRDFCGQDFAPLLAKHPRLVLFRTFSKAFAAASLRCGSLFAAPALCAELRKVQLPYNLSAPTCLIAGELLARPELVEERARLVAAERERIGGALQDRGCTAHPSGANFILFEQDARPPRELHGALFRRGVLIRDVSSAEGLGRALRVSIGARAANDAFLAALEAEL